MTRKRVVVVGAGIAGLTAAYELLKTGCEVIVLERAAVAGGRMGDELRGSLRVVTGASVLFNFYRDMLEIIHDVGISERIEPLPWGEAATVYTGGGEHFVSAQGSILRLLRSPLVSRRSKARLALLQPDIVRARRTTDPNLAHTAARFDDESLAVYIARTVGEDFLENVVEPFFRANWNWEPEDISKGYFLSLYPHLGRKLEVFTFKDGIGLLTRTLATRLDVRVNMTVTRVEPRGNGAGRVVFAVGPDGPEVFGADLVIVATPATEARRIVADLSDAERAFFASVRYTPLGIVHYVLNKPPRGGERGGFYARSHSSPFAIFRAVNADPTNPEKPHRLYCELTPQRVHEYLTAPGAREAGLDAFVRPLARSMYPTLDDDLAEVHEQWWDEMLCAFYPGYITTMAGFLTAHESRPREVYYAGDYLSHSHTGGACASGRRAARLAARHWRLGVAER